MFILPPPCLIDSSSANMLSYELCSCTKCFLVSDTHALVQFLDEDATAIVPISRLKDPENLEHGGTCIVKWSNKKEYKALLLCSGLWKFVYGKY